MVYKNKSGNFATIKIIYKMNLEKNKLLHYYYKAVLEVFNSDFIDKKYIDNAIKLRDEFEK